MPQVYIAWQDPETRSWFPVGSLQRIGGRYRFVYTKGALESHWFVPFGGLPKLDVVYESESLFPLFANRLISSSRPEYKDFLRWLNLVDEGADPLQILSLTGGRRETDSLIVYSKPEPTSDGRYEVDFFCQGIRYYPGAVERVGCLDSGEQLYLMPDPQNPHHACAVALRTEDPPVFVGYCPRYLARDFLRLLEGSGEVQVTVVRVNQDAPIQQRLLCHLSSDWLAGFESCSGSAYEPIPELASEQVAVALA